MAAAEALPVQMEELSKAEAESPVGNDLCRDEYLFTQGGYDLPKSDGRRCIFKAWNNSVVKCIQVSNITKRIAVVVMTQGGEY